MLSKELVNQLKTIFKEEFQVELTPSSADDVANSLVSYYEILAKNYFLQNQTKSRNHEQ